MNSWEENELFEAHGWSKNLIARQWESPTGSVVIAFDDLMAITETPEGEAWLRVAVATYGEVPRG